MPGTRDKHNKRRDSSSSDSSSSSSSSESSCSSKVYSKKKCDYKKNKNISSDCEKKNHSDHQIECYSNDKEWKCKSKKYHKEHKSSSSSSDSEHKYDFNDIYQFFKNKLIKDNQLMVFGSNAYYSGNSIEPDTIATTHAVHLENTYMKYNVDHPKINDPFFVREAGIYQLTFVIDTDSSAQFSIFVNGVLRDLTTIGTNSGAGQVVLRSIFTLNKNDNLVIRNYISNIAAVDTNLYSGGLQEGNDITILLFKVAPLCTPEPNHDEIKCYTHNKLKLFKKLTKKLLCDSELMIRGFNVHGSFYNNTTQTVPTEADVKFGNFSNVNGLVWNPTTLNPEQIKVLENGIYQVVFLANTNTAAQFTFYVNGNPIVETTQGINKGSGQATIRSLLELKQNDILTVRNHTSANGSIVISEHAGGNKLNVNTLCQLIKLAPIVKPQVKPVNHKVEKHFECYYKKFRNYLLCKEWLQITGSSAYIGLCGSTPEKVNVDESFNWADMTVNKHVDFVPGNPFVVIKKSGVYDVIADVITNEPQQLALFVNGSPDLSTIFGRDSGAARTLLKQLVQLNKGDVVTLNNYESNAGNVNLAQNPGGQCVGLNKQLTFVLLNPVCEPKHDSDNE
jgi:hypothetical protein